jgi:hypothetical protein
MNKAKLTTILFLIFFYSIPISSAELNPIQDGMRTTSAKSDESKVTIINNTTRCQLYSKKCFIKILLSDSDIMNNLKIISTDKQLMRYKSIEQCYLNSTKSDCITSYDLLIKSNPNLALNSLYLFLVYLKPKLVGINNIEFIYNETFHGHNHDHDSGFETSLSNHFHELDDEDSLYKTIYLFHTIIVTTPERLVDKIQLIYVVFFSCVMSTIMVSLILFYLLKKISFYVFFKLFFFFNSRAFY